MADGKRQVEPAQYEANLKQLVSKLKSTGARLVWCSTTPIPEGELKPKRTFGNVAEYNAIAAGVMKEAGIATNDLNAWVTPRFEELHNPQDLHFTAKGSDFLAEKVAQEILRVLEP